MDVDMSVHPSQLPSLVAALDDADVAIGSRSLSESETECDSVLRIVMGRSFARVVKILIDLHLRDTQCGFKAYLAPVARVLFHCATVDRFSFDVEVLAKARQLGLRITEVPVHWRHRTLSRVRPFKDPIVMVADVIKIRRGRRKVANIPGVVIRSLPGLTPPARTARWALGRPCRLFPGGGTTLWSSFRSVK
jgi:hypothetical protein